MNVKEYENEFVNWVNYKIVDRIYNVKEADEPIEEFMKKNIYSITIDFDQSGTLWKYRNAADTKMIGEIELGQFNSFYNMVCREKLGRNYNKHPAADKPFAFAAIDANGSRYWDRMGYIENVHIHSIWIMNEEERNCFDVAMKKISTKDCFDIKSAHFENYRGDIRRLISYTLKFDKFTRGDAEISSTFIMYPKDNK